MGELTTRTTVLSARLMRETMNVLSQAPTGPENVHIALNALAICAATVLAGTEDVADQIFFAEALHQQLAARR